MPEQLTPLEPGRTYHIYNHANGSENLFREDENYRYFLQKYRQYIGPIAETYAYCLLPNHFHFMLAILEEKELRSHDAFQDLPHGDYPRILSQQFSHLFNGYTQAYNKRFSRRGSLFMSRFKRKLVDSDKYRTELLIYIHNNPVNHRFRDSPDAWPHSSWQHYLNDDCDDPAIIKGRNWFASKNDFISAHGKAGANPLEGLEPSGGSWRVV